MRYKLVLFDFDGTLADSFAWFLTALDSVAQRYRFRSIAPHEVETLRRLDSRALLAHLGLPWWKVPLVAAAMRRRMTADAQQIALFDGVEALLARLSAAGIASGLVTSNSERNVRLILGERNVAHLRYMECGAALAGKTARFRKLHKASGLAAHEIVCIGDELRDAQAARAAGLAFIGVGWGYTQLEALAPHSACPPLRTLHALADALCARGAEDA